MRSRRAARPLMYLRGSALVERGTRNTTPRPQSKLQHIIVVARSAPKCPSARTELQPSRPWELAALRGPSGGSTALGDSGQCPRGEEKVPRMSRQYTAPVSTGSSFDHSSHHPNRAKCDDYSQINGVDILSTILSTPDWEEGAWFDHSKEINQLLSIYELQLLCYSVSLQQKQREHGTVCEAFAEPQRL